VRNTEKEVKRTQQRGQEIQEIYFLLHKPEIADGETARSDNAKRLGCVCVGRRERFQCLGKAVKIQGQLNGLNLEVAGMTRAHLRRMKQFRGGCTGEESEEC
jgi:hypothetical protein